MVHDIVKPFGPFGLLLSDIAAKQKTINLAKRHELVTRLETWGKNWGKGCHIQKILNFLQIITPIFAPIKATSYTQLIGRKTPSPTTTVEFQHESFWIQVMDSMGFFSFQKPIWGTSLPPRQKGPRVGDALHLERRNFVEQFVGHFPKSLRVFGCFFKEITSSGSKSEIRAK